MLNNLNQDLKKAGPDERIFVLVYFLGYQTLDKNTNLRSF